MSDTLDRRSFLRLTGTGVVLLTTGATTALADEDDLREAARSHVAAETGVDESDLEIVTESLATYPTVDERYYAAKVREPSGRTHGATLDAEGSVIDRDEIEQREASAYDEEYGSLTPDMAERVASAEDDEQLEIGVWHRGADRGAAKRAIGFETMANDAEAKRELSEEVRDRIERKSEALADRIRAVDGARVTEVGAGEPRVGAVATSAAIEEIETLGDVWRVFRADLRQAGPELEDASLTHESYSERNNDYDASGYPVGIFEYSGYPELDNVNIADSYRTYSNVSKSDHAHKVSMCAGSTDDDQPGIASEADIYCAADPRSNLDDKIQWFDGEGVSAVNCSWYANADGERPMNEWDFRFGQYVINYWLNVVKSAGNYSSTDDYIVSTPGKGFNQIAAGAIDDQNTGDDKSDDERASFSCWKDPRSKHDSPDYDDYPHDKPEVSAVGYPMGFPGYSGSYSGGTSYAAPHVSGLITLLAKFADDYDTVDFSYYPELVKPILMASATNQGDSSYDFEEMGTGAIVAPHAEDVVDYEWFHSDLFDSSNDQQTYEFYASKYNTEVRMALMWLTDVTDSDFSDNSNAQSDLDLDFWVDDPDGNYVAGSYEYDRGFEWLTFEPETSGTHTITVDNYRWDSSDSSRWIGLAWHRAY